MRVNGAIAIKKDAFKLADKMKDAMLNQGVWSSAGTILTPVLKNSNIGYCFNRTVQMEC